VCQLTAEHLVAPTAGGASLTLAGFISDDQLRVIEDIRAGGAVVLHLKLGILTTTGNRLERYRGDENIDVTAGEWNTEIDRAGAGTFVDVLVPMSSMKTYAQAVARIREGRDLLRTGDEQQTVDSALVKARQALEPVRDKLRTSATARAAGTVASQRSQAERQAVMIEAIFSYITGAAHDDAITQQFEYTRTDAITMLAAVGGLVRSVTEQL
jgi:hypothetical protein